MIRIQVLTLKQLIGRVVAVIVAIALIVLLIVALARGTKENDSVAPSTRAEACTVSASLPSARAEESEDFADKLAKLIKMLFGFDPTDPAEIVMYALVGSPKEAKDALVVENDDTGRDSQSYSITVRVDELDREFGEKWSFAPATPFESVADGLRVFIYHTHTTEAYADSANQTSSWRTRDSSENIVGVGRILCSRLNAIGIETSHCETYHENPNFNYAYSQSLISLREEYNAHPENSLYIDLHRDAWIAGSSRPRAIEANGKSCAQLMFVVAAGYDDDPNPYWEQNYALAKRFGETLNSLAPGICRDIRVAEARYNQFVAPNCMLIEVGHNENTLEEAMNSMEYLSLAIASVLSE